MDMVNSEFIQEAVRGVLPDAEVHPTDLTGSGDHWHVVVVDPSFEGQMPLARQRPILSAFQEHLQAEVVHALDLRCMTPAELEDRHGGKIPVPFMPH